MHALPSQGLPYDPNQVTPGVIGFAVTALLAIVVMLLLWDFNRRVRRINDREDVKQRLAAEVAAADAERSGSVPGPEADGGPAAAASPTTADGGAAAAASPTASADPEAPQVPRG